MKTTQPFGESNLFLYNKLKNKQKTKQKRKYALFFAFVLTIL